KSRRTEQPESGGRLSGRTSAGGGLPDGGNGVHAHACGGSRRFAKAGGHDLARGSPARQDSESDRRTRARTRVAYPAAISRSCCFQLVAGWSAASRMINKLFQRLFRALLRFG